MILAALIFFKLFYYINKSNMANCRSWSTQMLKYLLENFDVSLLKNDIRVFRLPITAISSCVSSGRTDAASESVLLSRTGPLWTVWRPGTWRWNADRTATPRWDEPLSGFVTISRSGADDLLPQNINQDSQLHDHICTSHYWLSLYQIESYVAHI